MTPKLYPRAVSPQIRQSGRGRFIFDIESYSRKSNGFRSKIEWYVLCDEVTRDCPLRIIDQVLESD